MVAFVCADPALSEKVAPIFIFTGKRVSADFISECSKIFAGTCCICTESGGVDKSMFHLIIEHFVTQVKAIGLPEQDYALFLDKPAVHITIAGFEIALKNRTNLISPPSQTTDKTQVLVRFFFLHPSLL
jgi:DDE superfamily endonuclease